MNKGDDKINRNDWILWGSLFILETVILFFGLTHEGVWYDEACSVGIIRHPLPAIWDIVKGDVHPPLYFYILKVIVMLFGESVFAMRTVSVLGILALFSLGIGPVRRALSKTAGLWFSFLVMMIPIYLAAAQEIRMYTWAVFFVTGSVLYAYLAVSGNRKSDWTKLCVLMLASIYTHYYALIAIVVLCGLIMIRLLMAPKKQTIVLFLITVGLVIIGYSPWLFGFSVQVDGISKDNFWVPPMRADIIWQTLIYPFGYKLPIIDPLAVIGFWLSVGLILWGLGRSFKQRQVTVAHLAIGVYILTLLAAVIFSLLFWPILFARHLLPVSGLLLLGIAHGLEQLPGKERVTHVRASAAFALIFVGLMIPHIININQNRFNGPLQEITGYFKENLKPGDVFIHSAPDAWGVFNYYFPNHKHFLYIIHSDPGFAYCKTFQPNGTAGLDLHQFIHNNDPDRIWLIEQSFVAENSMVKIFDEKSILETRLFKILGSSFAVRIYKIKPGGKSARVRS